MHAGTEETRTTAVDMSQRQSTSKRTPIRAESVFGRLQVLRRVGPPSGHVAPKRFQPIKLQSSLLYMQCEHQHNVEGFRAGTVHSANLMRSCYYGFLCNYDTVPDSCL
jgi:hypothetical protein